MFAAHLKNNCQNWNLPQVGVKIIHLVSIETSYGVKAFKKTHWWLNCVVVVVAAPKMIVKVWNICFVEGRSMLENPEISRLLNLNITHLKRKIIFSKAPHLGGFTLIFQGLGYVFLFPCKKNPFPGSQRPLTKMVPWNCWWNKSLLKWSFPKDYLIIKLSTTGPPGLFLYSKFAWQIDSPLRFF